MWYYLFFMKINHKNSAEDIPGFYVVTRKGRRIEDRNYKTEKAAQYRAAQLIQMVKEWSPDERGSVSIVSTTNPGKIY